MVCAVPLDGVKGETASLVAPDMEASQLFLKAHKAKAFKAPKAHAPVPHAPKAPKAKGIKAKAHKG